MECNYVPKKYIRCLQIFLRGDMFLTGGDSIGNAKKYNSHDRISQTTAFMSFLTTTNRGGQIFPKKYRCKEQKIDMYLVEQFFENFPQT